MSQPAAHAPPASLLKVPFGDGELKLTACPGVSEEQLKMFAESTLFKQWKERLFSPKGGLLGPNGGGTKIEELKLQVVDMFGKRIGFAKFEAVVVDSDGTRLPGIVFARGGAVAILILLYNAGEAFAVLTEQARVPIGRLTLEIPAGMLDGQTGDFLGVAAKEVKEETGISIKAEELVDLTSHLADTTEKTMYPSQGGCDEDIRLFLYRKEASSEVIDKLKGKLTGLRAHGEKIRLHVVPYKQLWRFTGDSKALSAIALYEMALRDKLIPEFKGTLHA
eukprot:jgi/Mesvir1/14571/Mv05251-RA.1